MLQKKREMEARLLWANKPDKLQQAKDEISEVGNGAGGVSALFLPSMLQWGIFWAGEGTFWAGDHLLSGRDRCVWPSCTKG